MLLRLLCFILVASFASTPAIAAQRLVDSAPTSVLRVDLRWSDIYATRGESDLGFHQMRALVPRVNYRLELAPYVGRRARINLVIPQSRGLTSPQGLLVQWSSDGQIINGQAYAGQRRMVRVGKIESPVLVLQVDFELIVDSRLFTGQLNFEPYFEIELEP